MIILFLLGLILGSFTNVLIYRLRKKESFVVSRSYCPHCKKQLRWYHNIPVFSYLFLGGRCAFCQKKISRQYPLVELAMGVIFVIVGLAAGVMDGSVDVAGWLFLPLAGGWGKFVYLALVSVLLMVVFVYDLYWKEIPDGVVAFGGLLSAGYLLLDLTLSGASARDWFFQVLAGLGGAAVVAGFFYFQFWYSQGRWIGGGDVKLGAWLGFMLGLGQVYPFLLIAYVLGAVVALVLLWQRKKKMKSQIPFGPFLALSAWLLVVVGEKFSDFWHGIYF